MLLFFVTLVICIVCHELSHAVAAMICKCKIEEIALGFGKSLYQKKIKEILYRINIVPLGGYCKLKGELTETRAKDAFVNLIYRKKFCIAIAGCLCNIIMGAIALYLCLRFNSFTLYYFGVISMALGITNLLPIPALDGGYIVYFPLFIRIFGKKIGIRRFRIMTNIGFMIIMFLNILFLPFIFGQLIRGKL